MVVARCSSFKEIETKSPHLQGGRIDGASPLRLVHNQRHPPSRLPPRHPHSLAQEAICETFPLELVARKGPACSRKHAFPFSLTAKNYALHILPCQQAGLPSSITLHCARHCVPPCLHVWVFLFQDLTVYPCLLELYSFVRCALCLRNSSCISISPSSIWLPLICQAWSQGPHSHSDVHVSAPHVSNWMWGKPIQSDNRDAHGSSCNEAWYKGERRKEEIEVWAGYQGRDGAKGELN